MTIELTYENLMTPMFQMALGKLFTYPDFTTEFAWKLAKVKKVVDSEMKILDETKQKLVTKYSKKDDDGKPLAGAEKGTVQLEDPDAFNSELDELKAKTFEVELPLLTLAELKKKASKENPLKLNPAELDALTPFIDDESGV